MVEHDRLTTIWDNGREDGVKQCAAGPWIDGPPPKDERDYLGCWGPGYISVGVTSWNPVVKQWNVEDQYIDIDPIMHAVINLPEVK